MSNGSYAKDSAKDSAKTYTSTANTDANKYEVTGQKIPPEDVIQNNSAVNEPSTIDADVGNEAWTPESPMSVEGPGEDEVDKLEISAPAPISEQAEDMIMKSDVEGLNSLPYEQKDYVATSYGVSIVGNNFGKEEVEKMKEMLKKQEKRKQGKE